MDLDNRTLEQLFDAADRIGNRYLSTQELQQRDRKRAEAASALAEVIGRLEVEA